MAGLDDRGERETASQLAVALGELALLVSGPKGVVTVSLRRVTAITFGRSAESDVVLDDDAVSRRHAVLRLGGQPSIEDLGSRNGTSVGGRRIAPGTRVPVGLGAILEIGAATVVLYRQRGVTAETTPRVERDGRAARDRRGVVVVDPAVTRIYAMLDVVGPSALPVLVLGETGTGKEVFARAIHAHSHRSEGPFAAINCAAIPEQLLESELFGYDKGAFTGATQAKPGLIETADGGTLFLDELADSPLPLQAKLLRVLESGEVRRLGSVKARRVDVRVVAATNRDLQALVTSNDFRADLFYRLNGFALTLPPLRERPADVVALAASFAATAAGGAAPAPALAGDVEAALLAHDWPGNVRELRVVMERAVALSRGGPIDVAHLMLPARRAAGDAATPRSTRPKGAADERALILDALTRTSGNQKEAASLLGISRRTMIKKIERHDIGRPRKIKA